MWFSLDFAICCRIWRICLKFGWFFQLLLFMQFFVLWQFKLLVGKNSWFFLTNCRIRWKRLLPLLLSLSRSNIGRSLWAAYLFFLCSQQKCAKLQEANAQNETDKPTEMPHLLLTFFKKSQRFLIYVQYVFWFEVGTFFLIQFKSAKLSFQKCL